MLKPTTKQRVVSVTKIVVTIGVVFGSLKAALRENRSALWPRQHLSFRAPN